MLSHWCQHHLQLYARVASSDGVGPSPLDGKWKTCSFTLLAGPAWSPLWGWLSEERSLHH